MVAYDITSEGEKQTLKNNYFAGFILKYLSLYFRHDLSQLL